MDIFLKTIAIVLVGIILSTAIQRGAKDFSVLIIVLVCMGVVAVMCSFMEPVFQFLQTLEQYGALDNDMLILVSKVTGIGVLSEFISAICVDSGNSSVGKVVQLLGSAVVLWLSLPLFTMLVQLINHILSNI